MPESTCLHIQDRPSGPIRVVEIPWLTVRIGRASYCEVRLDEAPFLLGYVVTRPKATAEVILASEAGDPLLAWWRYGLGMTVAFTSDAKSRWAADWVTWKGFDKFWTNMFRDQLPHGEAGEAKEIGRAHV